MVANKSMQPGRLAARSVMLGACVALAAPAMSSGAAGAPQQAGPAAAQTQAAEKLALRIRAELATLPENATVEDREASVVFAVSQGDIPLETVLAALTMVEGVPGVPALSKQAVANVRIALLRRKLTRGTAALGSGNGFGSAGFSAPIVSIGGGGGSNYSQ